MFWWLPQSLGPVLTYLCFEKKKFSTNDSNFHHPMIGVPTWPGIGGIFQILLIGGLEHLFSLIYFP
jgi:hypothetical protein